MITTKYHFYHAVPFWNDEKGKESSNVFKQSAIWELRYVLGLYSVTNYNRNIITPDKCDMWSSPWRHAGERRIIPTKGREFKMSGWEKEQRTMQRGSHDEDRGEERGRSRRETHCVHANLYAEVKCCGLLPTRFALSFSWIAASAKMICRSRSCVYCSCDGEPLSQQDFVLHVHVHIEHIYVRGEERMMGKEEKRWALMWGEERDFKQTLSQSLNSQNSLAKPRSPSPEGA